MDQVAVHPVTFNLVDTAPIGTLDHGFRLATPLFASANRLASENGPGSHNDFSLHDSEGQQPTQAEFGQSEVEVVGVISKTSTPVAEVLYFM